MTEKQSPSNLPRITIKANLDEPDYGTSGEETTDPDEYNLITSKLHSLGNMHAPALDLDIPHAYVASTTEGHGHLYIDVPMEWEMYKKVLYVLAEAGIIEEGYANASIKKGYSSLRPPWVKKTPEQAAKQKAKLKPVAVPKKKLEFKFSKSKMPKFFPVPNANPVDFYGGY